MARKSRKISIPPAPVTYNTAIYLRLSVKNESLLNQKQLLAQYIANHPEFILLKTFTDNGETGTNFKRPAWNSLIQECKQGNFNCIIIKDLSRMGRNYIETGDYLERILPTLGVRLIAVSDGYDSQNLTNNARLVSNIKNLVNDFYAKDISRKVLATIRRKQQRGLFVGSLPPYGYLKGPEEGKLLIDPDTAPIVRKIFEMKATGIGNGAICKKLNSENIPCPNRYRYLTGLAQSKKYENTIWITSTIAAILRNPAYQGKAAYICEAIIPQRLS